MLIRVLPRNCGGVEPGNLKYLRCNGLFFFADCVFSRKGDLLQAAGLGVLALSVFNGNETFKMRLAGSSEEKGCG